MLSGYCDRYSYRTFIYYTLPFGKFQTKINLSTMEVDGLVMIDSVESKLIEDILKCTSTDCYLASENFKVFLIPLRTAKLCLITPREVLLMIDQFEPLAVAGYRRSGNEVTDDFLPSFDSRQGRRALRQRADKDEPIGSVLLALETVYRSVEVHVDENENDTEGNIPTG